ncbi:MAG: NAD(P)H-hydrate dehydratase [Sphingomonadales bacterium]
MTPLAGPVLTAAEMLAAERACGVPLDELMERAGRALAEAAVRFGSGQAVLVACGPGNNGGDGYVAARVLAGRGVAVRVAASGEPTTDLARAARSRWNGPVEALHTAETAPVLVDALFGTGLRRGLDEMLGSALQRLVSGAKLTIAADLPSGFASDDGADLGGAGADITIAFGAAKPAHLLLPAASRCGHVLIAYIGIEFTSKINVLSKPHLRIPGPNDHKYTRGMVAIVGGEMPGAAALAAQAAARSGAGYVVTLGLDRPLPNAIVSRPMCRLALTLADKRLGAMVIGPGLGTTNDDALTQALASNVPMVIDGDSLPNFTRRDAPTILTPHAGEFSRLFGDKGGSKLDRTRIAARSANATIIHKGADTVIASPDGRATLAPLGSPWLSTAGTGDVLAGVAGAMLARGLDTYDAACAAVWLHAEAARRVGAVLIADDLLRHLPTVAAVASR